MRSPHPVHRSAAAFACLVVAAALVGPAGAAPPPVAGVFVEDWTEYAEWENYGMDVVADGGSLTVRPGYWGSMVNRLASEEPVTGIYLTQSGVSTQGMTLSPDGATVLEFSLEAEGARTFGGAQLGLTLAGHGWDAAVAVQLFDSSSYPGAPYALWTFGPGIDGYWCQAGGSASPRIAVDAPSGTVTVSASGCPDRVAVLGFEPEYATNIDLYSYDYYNRGDTWTFGPIALTGGTGIPDPVTTSLDCLEALLDLHPCAGFREDFESGAAGWTFEGDSDDLLPPWAASWDEPQPAGYVDGYWHVEGIEHNGVVGGHELRYSSPGDYTYVSQDGAHRGTATSPSFLVPVAGPTLAFESTEYGYSSASRTVEMSVDGGSTWERLGGVAGYWGTRTFDLDAYAGEVAQLRFVFEYTGSTHGWSIDEIRVTGSESAHPAAPLRLVATAGWTEGEIGLSWLPPPDVGNAGEVRYRILRWTADGGAPVTLPVTDETFAFDVGLDPLKRYYYAVIAFNNAGESPRSNEASATPDPLDERFTVEDECGSDDYDVYVCAHGNPHAGLAAIVLCGDPRAPLVVTANRVCPYIGEGSL